MVHIFGKPDFDGPLPFAMSSFEYLNRSTRESTARIRVATEQWLSRYPALERDRLISRIRSDDDIDHHSAYFELILHELLLRSDCRVEVEQQLGTKGKYPDFLVFPPEGGRFVLEAVTASGVPDKMRGKLKLLKAILRTIDEMPSPRFWLLLEWQGLPDVSPPLKQLRQSLNTWLEGLAPNDPEREFAWECPGFSLKAMAHARRMPGSRSIGSTMPELRWVLAKDDIAKRVRDKANTYGDLDMPFVIAVNSLDDYADSSEFLGALFGSEVALPQRSADGEIEYVSNRIPDGVFFGKMGPERTSISAVVCSCKLTPWQLTQRHLMLVRHPNASRPLREFPLPTATLLSCGDDLWGSAPTVAESLGFATDCIS